MPSLSPSTPNKTTKLQDAFQITPNVTSADIPTISAMAVDALLSNDPIWQALLRNSTRQDGIDFHTKVHESRLRQPGYTYFKIVEKNTGKLIAWTSLVGPMPPAPAPKDPVTMPEIPGMDKHVGAFIAKMAVAGYGYDPEKHYHRRGTFVLPEYQSRGLGTWLSEHCNKIADDAGCTTYIRTQTAEKHFEKMGFEIVKVFEIELGEKVEEKKMARQVALKREPQKVT